MKFGINQGVSTMKKIIPCALKLTFLSLLPLMTANGVDDIIPNKSSVGQGFFDAKSIPLEGKGKYLIFDNINNRCYYTNKKPKKYVLINPKTGMQHFTDENPADYPKEEYRIIWCDGCQDGHPTVFFDPKVLHICEPYTRECTDGTVLVEENHIVDNPEKNFISKEDKCNDADEKPKKYVLVDPKTGKEHFTDENPADYPKEKYRIIWCDDCADGHPTVFFDPKVLRICEPGY
jgi:hypothetical protein